MLRRRWCAACSPCSAPDKRAHRSQAAARRYQRRLGHVAGGNKDRRWPYECPGGGHWHLTHQDPDEQKRVAARIDAQRGQP